MNVEDINKVENFNEIIVILVGQLRCYSKSQEFIKRLATAHRVFVYTDEAGVGLLSDAEEFERVIDTSLKPKFLEVMEHADSEACKSKLYQWGRLAVAIDDLLRMRSSGEISSSATILKIRSDVRLRALRLNRIRNLAPTTFASKTDWVYAFNASRLETMQSLITRVLDWKQERKLEAIPVETMPQIEGAALRINWVPFSFEKGLLRSFVFRSQARFSTLGRVGEWAHRVLVLTMLKIATEPADVQVEGSNRRYSKPRHIREDNCVASEIIFTVHILENFRQILRLFPIGRGSLVANRKARNL